MYKRTHGETEVLLCNVVRRASFFEERRGRYWHRRQGHRVRGRRWQGGQGCRGKGSEPVGWCRYLFSQEGTKSNSQRQRENVTSSPHGRFEENCAAERGIQQKTAETQKRRQKDGEALEKVVEGLKMTAVVSLITGPDVGTMWALVPEPGKVF